MSHYERDCIQFNDSSSINQDTVYFEITGIERDRSRIVSIGRAALNSSCRSKCQWHFRLDMNACTFQHSTGRAYFL